MHIFRDMIFLALFFVFLIVGILLWAAFHVAGGGVHLLIALAFVFLVIHFVRRYRRTV